MKKNKIFLLLTFLFLGTIKQILPKFRNRPILLIHGGTKCLKNETKKKMYHKALSSIIKNAYTVLQSSNAKNGVIEAVKYLEDDPIFNAGTGSRIQKDGKIRMSAALMGGPTEKFSGVINIENVKNPIQISDLLSHKKHSILAGPEAKLFANENNIPDHSTMTSQRFNEYLKKQIGKTGTVGAVALDAHGKLWAGTSTGGLGGETPGRVGDSPTIAGTFASPKAAVSCTGTGEQIINNAVAAKVVIRVNDGMPLEEAVEKTVKEGNEKGNNFGFIALNNQGEAKVGQTNSACVLYAYYDGKKIRTFFNDTSRTRHFSSNLLIIDQSLKEEK